MIYSNISIGSPSFINSFCERLLLSALTPFLNTLVGNRSLHSSHSIAFQQYVDTYGPSFDVFLELSHSLKHSRWINLHVPEHLQGEINGSSSVFSSPRHILQTWPTIFSCCSFINASFISFRRVFLFYSLISLSLFFATFALTVFSGVKGSFFLS
jgi:hypothetical protein